MIETINGKAYLKKGDKVYELGGGSNIITADSVEQLPDPASVPEGTVALVPSDGGGGVGLPVVELTTAIDTETATPLSEAENQALDVALGKGLPIVCKLNAGGYMTNIAALMQTEQGTAYLINIGNGISVAIMKIDSGWSVTVQYEG